MRVFELSPTQRSEAMALKATLRAAIDPIARVEAWVALQTYLLSLVDAAPKSKVHLTTNNISIIYQKKDV